MYEVLISEEVEEWYMALTGADLAKAERMIDLLSTEGPSLRMPHSKYLKGKLWELRFSCAGVNRRITYTIEKDVITLTTFRKQRQNESTEIARARVALKRHNEKEDEQ